VITPTGSGHLQPGLRPLFASRTGAISHDPRTRDRTAVARAVASRVVRYRVEHGLSQAELGGKLGVSQPYVARLESGDQSPTLAMLARLAQRLGLEFHIDVTPTNVHISA
jgi:ribosome-binding protein aMBF1 (putative translation factor)